MTSLGHSNDSLGRSNLTDGSFKLKGLFQRPFSAIFSVIFPKGAFKNPSTPIQS
jgi:hypothetical protein